MCALFRGASRSLALEQTRDPKHVAWRDAHTEPHIHSGPFARALSVGRALLVPRALRVGRAVPVGRTQSGIDFLPVGPAR